MIENLPDIFDDVNFDGHLRHVTPAADLSAQDKEHKILKLVEKEGNRPVAVYGNHHQAIDLNSLHKDLRVLLVWDLGKRGVIPYALYDRTYTPGMWLTQFHPEVKEEFGGAMAKQLSNLNTEIFDSFFEMMKERKLTTLPTETPAASSQPAVQ